MMEGGRQGMDREKDVEREVGIEIEGLREREAYGGIERGGEVEMMERGRQGTDKDRDVEREGGIEMEGWRGRCV